MGFEVVTRNGHTVAALGHSHACSRGTRASVKRFSQLPFTLPCPPSHQSQTVGFCPAEAAVIPICRESLGRRLEVTTPPRERWRSRDFAELFQPQGLLSFGCTRLVLALEGGPSFGNFGSIPGDEHDRPSEGSVPGTSFSAPSAQYHAALGPKVARGAGVGPQPRAMSLSRR